MVDRKDVLLSFYDEVTTFQYELMAVNFGDFPFDEGKSLYDYQVRFYESVSDILKSYQRLVIYLEPESELLAFANNITASVIECRKVVKENFGKIKTTSVDEQLAYLAIERDGKESYISATEEADRANSFYWGLMKPHMNLFIENYRGYLTTLNVDFQSRQIQHSKSNKKNSS